MLYGCSTILPVTTKRDASSSVQDDTTVLMSNHIDADNIIKLIILDGKDISDLPLTQSKYACNIALMI